MEKFPLLIFNFHPFLKNGSFRKNCWTAGMQMQLNWGLKNCIFVPLHIRTMEHQFVFASNARACLRCFCSPSKALCLCRLARNAGVRRSRTRKTLHSILSAGCFPQSKHLLSIPRPTSQMRAVHVCSCAIINATLLRYIANENSRSLEDPLNLRFGS
ncbi:hypothetical protein M426DRAFT_79286 [Hypoxylon sp. CI-4A]|nr:hypothetical protein M426DRAFT_79286 [Hypoxylon sp. CI-4A]